MARKLNLKPTLPLYYTCNLTCMKLYYHVLFDAISPDLWKFHLKWPHFLLLLSGRHPRCTFLSIFFHLCLSIYAAVRQSFSPKILWIGIPCDNYIFSVCDHFSLRHSKLKSLEGMNLVLFKSTSCSHWKAIMSPDSPLRSITKIALALYLSLLTLLWLTFRIWLISLW